MKISSPEDSRKLFLIRLVHTLIWVFMVVVIAYIVYAGVFNDVTFLAWIAIGFIILEGIVLLLNDGRCPLTPLAEQYTHERSENFDIFLPEWLARNNKRIFTPIAFAGAAIVLYRVFA